MGFLRFGLCLAVLAVALANEASMDGFNLPQRREHSPEKRNIRALIEDLEGKPKNQQIDDLNRKLDSALDYINELIDFNDKNWIQLPDIIDHKFSWVGDNENKAIVMKGKISLTQGWLGVFSNLARNGDCSFFYEGDYVIFDFPITYTSIDYNYKYKAKLVALNSKGDAMGKINGAQFVVRVQLHRVTLEAQLRNLAFVGPWKITVDITGLVHEFLNIVENVIDELMQPLLRSTMYSATLQIVNKAISVWNQ